MCVDFYNCMSTSIKYQKVSEMSTQKKTTALLHGRGQETQHNMANAAMGAKYTLGQADTSGMTLCVFLM